MGIVKEVDLMYPKSIYNRCTPRIQNKESPELDLIRGYTYHFRCDLNESDQFFISTSPITEKLSLYSLEDLFILKWYSNI